MPVLSVAESLERHGRSVTPDDDGQPAQSGDTGQQTIEIARFLRAGIDEYLSGFAPGGVDFTIDWDLLDPVVSVLASALTAVYGLRRLTAWV